MSEARKTDAKGEPEPVVKTRKVSELRLTHDQLVDAVREKYPEIGYGVVADALYGCSMLVGINFTWSEPIEGDGVTIIVNGSERVVTVTELSYEDVVKMVTGTRPLPMLSVTYSYKRGGGGSILNNGETVKVAQGMQINAYDTSNA